MKKTGYFATVAVFCAVLSGCSFSFDSIKSLFKKTAKETMELIVVSDEKKASLKNDTKNMYGVEFELTSNKPYDAKTAETFDISATPQKQYLSAFKEGMAVYEEKNGHSNIVQDGYYSASDRFVKYRKGEDTITIQSNGDSYSATRNGVVIDMSDSEEQKTMEDSYKIWENQMNYSFSYELNALINLKARLSGSTADEKTNVDFISKVKLKDYKDAGNYSAVYIGEAHKNDGANDVTIDYVEVKYVDYRLQYTLVHTIYVGFDSVIETHKLNYTKFVYNVNFENCFKDA